MKWRNATHDKCNAKIAELEQMLSWRGVRLDREVIRRREVEDECRKLKIELRHMTHTAKVETEARDDCARIIEELRANILTRWQARRVQDVLEQYDAYDHPRSQNEREALDALNRVADQGGQDDK